MCSCCQVLSINKIQQQLIGRNNHLYIVSYNKEYPINNIITVKFMQLDELQRKYSVIRYNHLKYSDIIIPADTSIDAYISLLEQDDNIISIDYNGYGSYTSISTNDTYDSNQWYLSAIQQLPQGVYLMTATSDGQAPITQKIIVQK